MYKYHPKYYKNLQRSTLLRLAFFFLLLKTNFSVEFSNWIPFCLCLMRRKGISKNIPLEPESQRPLSLLQPFGLQQKKWMFVRIKHNPFVAKKTSFGFRASSTLKMESTVPSSFKFAGIQLLVGEDKAKNLENARQKIEEAAKNGAQMISLPVCFFCRIYWSTRKFLTPPIRMTHLDHIARLLEKVLPLKCFQKPQKTIKFGWLEVMSFNNELV